MTRRLPLLAVVAVNAALLCPAVTTSTAEASSAGNLLPPPSLTYTPALTGGPAGQACGGTIRCVGPGQTYANIAAAVSAASNGDTIQVQAGTYGRINAGSKSLTLLGGFAGGNWTTRNPATNVTTIDAVSGGSALLSDGAMSFTIDGFTVIRGKAVAGAFGKYPGSGISISNAGTAVVTHNDVEHNKDGVVADCRCSTGGGINVDVTGSATISYNIVSDNAAQLGGGLALSGNGTIEGNLVENNRGESDHGGGMFLAGRDIVVRGNLVRGNGLTGGLGYDGWGGGAIFSGDSATTGTNVGRFEHNTWVGNGVHIDQGGGLFIDEGGKAFVTGDLFQQNTCARTSGGIYVDGQPQSDVAIENVTVIDNHCADQSQKGSGIFIQASKASIKNSIVTGNGGSSQVDVCPTCDAAGAVGTSSISYSHVAGGVTGMTAGTGMVTTAPTFVDRVNHDYRLADGSSAIDAADPASSIGNEPSGTRRDIGSYGGTGEGKAAGAGPGAPGAPAKPTATAGVESATVSWAAPVLNGGILTRYEVQTGSGATPIGCVNPTGTTCTATGLAAGAAVQFKVRAVTNVGTGAFSTLSDAVTPTAAGGGGDDDATPGLPVMTDVWNGSCDDVATGTTYEVGTGKTYTSIGAVPWQSLHGGDRVKIFYRSTPYKEKILLTESGTADHPITICGVPNSSGQRPVIDGNGATTAAGMQSDFDATQYRGLITVAAQEGDAWGYKPKYLVIDGLQLTGAYLNNPFTDRLGTSRMYPHNAAGVYVERGEYITMRDNVVTGNANGLFVASGNEEATISRHILVDGNTFVGNGVAGSDQEHSSYLEAEDLVYQFNHYDNLRATAGGAALKDRSAGTVVRFNWFNGGSRYLDLVDAEDSTGCTPCLTQLPGYRKTYVYGNVMVIDGAKTTNPIHYGNDSDPANWDPENHPEYALYSRQGTLYFFGNTFSAVSNQSANWSASLFDLSTNDESAQIWGNVFRSSPATAGQESTEWDLTRFHGTFHLGKNAFSPSMGTIRYPASNPGHPDPTKGEFDGTMNQTEWNNQLRPAGNDFGFADQAGGDFRPATGSALIDASDTAPVSVPSRHALAFQYVKHNVALGRQVNGTKLDLGAYENGPATSVGEGGGGGGGSDETAPRVALTGPTDHFVLGNASVTWTGSDNGSGLSDFQVRKQTAPYNAGFGAWTYPSSWQSLSRSTRKLSATLPSGATTCFSVRARDVAGNVSGWSASKCTALPLDDRSLTAGAGWTRATSSSFYKGTYTKAASARRTLSKSKARVSRIAIVATKCPTCGSVQVKVGSRVVGSVNLKASTTHNKQIVPLSTVSLRTGTVTLNTTSAKPVRIDGLGISSK